MSRVVTKPVFKIPPRTQHKQGCRPTEHDHRFEISELGIRRIVLYIELNFVAICIICFVYAKSRFSHDTAQGYMVY